MSAFKKRSSFQITSVTSDLIQSAASVAQGSSSQPTTPCLKRRYGSHDATGQGSRFRVVRLAAASGRGQSSRRGRWTCTDVMETQDGCSRVMDSMRHAHSLESLELIGRDTDGGGAYSQHYMLEPIRGGVHSQQPIRGFRAGPPPTPPGPNVRILATPGFDFALPPPLPRPRNIPPPLRLDLDSAGRSVLRLSHSQPSSPPAGPYHPSLTPDLPPAAFSLDQTIFNLPGDDRTLQLVAMQPETPVGAPVVLRDRRSVRGHVPGVRDSWPKTRQRSRPAPPVRTTDQSQPAPPARTKDQSQLAPLPSTTGQSRPATPPSTTDQSVAAPLPGGRGSEGTMTSLLLFCHSSSSNSLIAIDNKIEQAMDLVKSHLMLAVREEVELLRDQIRDLQEKNQQLQRENHILRTLTHNLHNT